LRRRHGARPGLRAHLRDRPRRRLRRPRLHRSTVVRHLRSARPRDRELPLLDLRHLLGRPRGETKLRPRERRHRVRELERDGSEAHRNALARRLHRLLPLRAPPHDPHAARGRAPAPRSAGETRLTRRIPDGRAGTPLAKARGEADEAIERGLAVGVVGAARLVGSEAVESMARPTLLGREPKELGRDRRDDAQLALALRRGEGDLREVEEETIDAIFLAELLDGRLLPIAKVAGDRTALASEEHADLVLAVRARQDLDEARPLIARETAILDLRLGERRLTALLAHVTREPASLGHRTRDHRDETTLEARDERLHLSRDGAVEPEDHDARCLLVEKRDRVKALSRGRVDHARLEADPGADELDETALLARAPMHRNARGFRDREDAFAVVEDRLGIEAERLALLRGR